MASKAIPVTTQTFDQEVINSNTPVVVDFWAPWCGPCRAIGPVLDELAGEWAGKVKVVKLNVDEEPAIAQAFNVRGIPTLVAMKGRDVVDLQVGAANRARLEKLFTSVAPAEAVAAS